MARRAVLFGSALGGLRGVSTDLDVMATLLGDRGFEVRRHEQGAATRAAVYEAYRRLIEDTAAGDVAMVYYSGHGARLERPADGSSPATAGPDAYQCIVPFDFDDSVPGDFRGITALELSALQAELTEQTDNVVVMLDCCYSGRLSRDPRLVPRALPAVGYVDVAAHLAALPADLLAAGRRFPGGNPSAVRLIAAGPTETAMELDEGSRSYGLFTEYVRRVLTRIGDLPVSWAVLLDEVRRRVQVISTGQRPEAEGPSQRLLFSTERAPEGALPVVVAAGRVTLQGGRIAGVEPGDRYAVMPPGSAAVDPAAQLAVLEVIASGAATAQVRVVVDPGRAAPVLLPGAVAFPVVKALRRHVVAVTGAGSGADRVRDAVAAATHVRLPDADDGSDTPLAEVVVEDGTARITDAAGSLLSPLSLAAPDAVPALVEDLNRLARAELLRALTPDPADALAEPIEVDVGLVVDGATRTLAAEDRPVLFVGQAVYLSVHNSGARRVFASVFDLGIDGAVTLLTNADPSGISVAEDTTMVIGEIATGELVGLPLSWPEGVPLGAPRSETVLVLAMSARTDLSTLAQEGVRGGASRGGPTLRQLADQIGTGSLRNLAPVAGGPVLRYSLHRKDFLVYPVAAPADETARFAVDARPDLSLRLGFRPPVAEPARAVEVRLTGVGARRGAFGGAPRARMDAVVVTGADPSSLVSLDTATVPLADRLAQDVVVHRGPAAGWLEVAIWLSEDRPGVGSLSDLLAGSLPGPVASGPARAAGGAPGAGARGSADEASDRARLQAAVDAVDTVALVVDAADEVVAGAVRGGGERGGLYRGSWLPGLETSLGAGLLTTADLSFRVVVDVVA
jgi:hypothetical protein